MFAFVGPPYGLVTVWLFFAHLVGKVDEMFKLGDEFGGGFEPS